MDPAAARRLQFAVHALARGYEVDTWVCNTRHMDPTWFQQPTDVLAKLKARAQAKGLVDDPRYGPAMVAVEQYVELGGRFVWGDLTPDLIGGILAMGNPLLTGTNGTYLYQCARETDAGPDDVRAHTDQNIGQGDHLWLHGRVAQQGGALGENGRHHDVHRRADARDRKAHLRAAQPFGRRVDEAVLDPDGSAERGESAQVQIDRTRPPGAPARHRNARPAESREQRAERVDRCAHRAHDLVRRLVRFDARGVDLEPPPLERGPDAEHAEELHHRSRVPEIGHVLEGAGPAREKGGRHERQHRVLRPADRHRSLEAARSLYDETVHSEAPSPGANAVTVRSSLL